MISGGSLLFGGERSTDFDYWGVSTTGWCCSAPCIRFSLDFLMSLAALFTLHVACLQGVVIGWAMLSWSCVQGRVSTIVYMVQTRL